LNISGFTPLQRSVVVLPILKEWPVMRGRLSFDHTELHMAMNVSLQRNDEERSVPNSHKKRVESSGEAVKWRERACGIEGLTLTQEEYFVATELIGFCPW
jgi:hypothetical protein